jgi:hypothetical protein
MELFLLQVREAPSLLRPLERVKFNHWTRHEVEVTLRQTVSRPVSLGVRPTSGSSDQFFFLLDIFFRQLLVCYFVAPSLTRGRVCNLLLLLVPFPMTLLVSIFA